MSHLTIDISPGSRDLLQELSQKTGQPIAQVLDNALAAYRRVVFFQAMNAGYAELRDDADSWAEHDAERRAWDQTLMDGLESDEP